MWIRRRTALAPYVNVPSAEDRVLKEDGRLMGTQADTAVRFVLRGATPDPSVGMRSLVDAGVYDIRRVAVGPRQSHGPGRQDGDACVLVLEGDVEFTVDDQRHALGAADLLWVPAAASRGFVAGDDGALLLAIHLPRGRRSAPSGALAGTVADQAVIARVTAHHAEMSAKLDLLTAAVAGSAAAVALNSSLSALVEYWRREVLPHAAAEEATIYAEAREVAGGATLIDALLLEHGDLQARAQGLAAFVEQSAAATPRGGDSAPAAVGQPGGSADSPRNLQSHASMQAAAAAALFHVHARKENELVLPALVAAGHALPPILERVERAFSAASRAVR